MMVRRFIVCLLFALFTFWYSTLLSAQESSSIPTYTLNRLIKEALEANPSINEVREVVEMARGDELKARAYPNPSLGLQYTWHTSPSQRDEPFLSLGQTFLYPGKLASRLQAAEKGIAAAEYLLKDVSLDIVMQVKEAFYSLLLTEENLRVAEKDAGFLSGLEDIAKKRFNTGDVAELDVIQAHTEAERARAAVDREQADMRKAVSALNTILGRKPEEPLRITGELQAAPEPFTIEELRQAIEHVPSLEEAGARVAQTESNMAYARYSRYPDFTLSLFHGAQPGDRTTGLNLSVPLPIWDRKEGEIKKAEAEHKKAVLALNALKAHLNLKLETAWQDYLISKRQVKLFQEGILKSASEGMRVARIGYKEGAIGLMDLLMARDRYLKTIKEYNHALFELRRAEAELSRLTGRLPE